LESVWGKTRYFKHRKYQNLGVQFVSVSLPYLLNICRKFEFLISQVIVATCLR